MTLDKLTQTDLKREIDDLQSRNNGLTDYREIFVAWFLRAYVTANEESAVSALCGGSRDKDVDAVLIDNNSRKVFIVQARCDSSACRDLCGGCRVTGCPTAMVDLTTPEGHTNIYVRAICTDGCRGDQLGCRSHHSSEVLVK